MPRQQLKLQVGLRRVFCISFFRYRYNSFCWRKDIKSIFFTLFRRQTAVLVDKTVLFKPKPFIYYVFRTFLNRVVE